MPKYKALVNIWSIELGRYVSEGEFFEVKDDSNFPKLIEMGVVEKVVSKPPHIRSTKLTEKSDASDN